MIPGGSGFWQVGRIEVIIIKPGLTMIPAVCIFEIGEKALYSGHRAVKFFGETGSNAADMWRVPLRLWE